MSETEGPSPARPGKSATAFRTIGEVAEDLDLPAHVLRFWEAKFPQLKPMKRGGGRRYYRPEDIQLLRRIRQCLYQEGYTIRGVQKLLGGPDPAEPEPQQASLFPADTAPPRSALGEPPAKPLRRPRKPATPPPPDRKTALEDIRRELQEARSQLDALLSHGEGS